VAHGIQHVFDGTVKILANPLTECLNNQFRQYAQAQIRTVPAELEGRLRDLLRENDA